MLTKNVAGSFELEFDICLALLDVNEVCLSGVFLKGLMFSTLPR